MAIEFFQSPRNGGFSHVFAKPSRRFLKKDATSEPSMETKKN
jgi:hypothetical protein